MVSDTILNPVLVWSVAAAALIMSSVLDIRGKDIPVRIPAFSAACQIVLLLWTEPLTVVLENLLFAGSVFLIFLVGNLFFGLGGADTLAASSSAIGIGVYGLLEALAALLFSIPYSLLRRSKGPYPFIPFLTAGYGCSLLWIILGY